MPKGRPWVEFVSLWDLQDFVTINCMSNCVFSIIGILNWFLALGVGQPIPGISIYTMMFQSAKWIKIKRLTWLLKITSLNCNKRKMLQKSLEKYLPNMLVTAIKNYQLGNVTSIQINNSKWSSFEKFSPSKDNGIKLL